MSYISKWRLQNNSVVPVGSNLFGTCNSGSSDTTKVVSLSAFNVLVEGVTIHVYFANANSGSNTLLQVGSTSAQPIKRNGVAEGKWESGSVISFTYSQGYWVQNDADVGGGGGETYTLSKNGNFITLTGSGGDTSSVIDDNTTYAIAVNGYQIVLTDSDGYSQRVTLPSGMYIVDDSNTLDEICGAYNDGRVIYYQYWANASTLRFLPLAEIDCSDHALFAQIINDGTDTYLLIAMVDENDDWSTSAIPIEATDTTYTISISGNDLTLTPSSGTAQTITLPIPTKTSDLTNDSNFVSDANYVHTDNNFTTAEKNKLSGIEAGAEVNVQSDWNQTNSSADDYIKNKPTIPTPPSPTTTTPIMDGTADVGSETNYARGDHVHPSDTSKQDTLVSGTNIKTINGNSVLGSGDLAVGGSVTSTDVPTADTIAEFDSDAHMNSTDMTSQEVKDFIDGLNITGGITDDNGTWKSVNNYLKYSKRFGCVYIQGVSSGTITLSAASWNNIGTLPEGYRPTSEIMFTAFDRNHLQPLWCSVTTAGVVRLYCDSGQTCSYWLYGGSFPVAS